MPEKNSNPNRRYYIDQTKKLANENGNLQGGILKEYNQFGEPTIQLPDGGLMPNAQSFTLAGVGVGDLVNPALAGVGKFDAEQPIPIGAQPTQVLQVAGAGDIQEESGEVKVLYTHFLNGDLKIMLGGHVNPPIEIATLPESVSIISFNLDNTGPGVTDYIIDLRIINGSNWEIYTFYGNASDGTSWSASESSSLSQRIFPRLMVFGSGFWSASAPIPKYDQLNAYEFSLQETVASVLPFIPAYTETTVNNSTSGQDPAISFTELKTDPDDEFFTFPGNTWEFTGTNLVDTRIEQVQSNFDSGIGEYLTVTWSERDRREYRSDTESASAYQGSITRRPASFVYEFDITTATITFEFDEDHLTNTGLRRYVVTDNSGENVDVPELFEIESEMAIAPGFVQDQFTRAEPVVNWTGVPSAFPSNPSILVLTPGSTVSANDMKESTPGLLPFGPRDYSRRLFTRFSREKTESFSSTPRAIFKNTDIVYYSEFTRTNDPANDTQAGARWGYYIGVPPEDPFVTENKIRSSQFGTKSTSYQPTLQQSGLEVSGGLEFYQVTSDVSSAANGSITADVRKDVVLNGSTFTQDTGATETTQHPVLQLFRSDGSAGSITVLQAKFYPPS